MNTTREKFYYYKIEDKQVLEQFHSLLAKKQAVLNRANNLAKDLGFEKCIGHNSRTYGINLEAFASPMTANLQFYKTRIGKDREIQYIPKKSCRAFYKNIKEEFEFLNGYGRLQAPFSYDEIDTLIIKNNNHGWNSVRPCIDFSDDVIIFKVENKPVEIYEHTEEIKASDYYRILEEIEEAEQVSEQSQ